MISISERSLNILSLLGGIMGDCYHSSYFISFQGGNLIILIIIFVYQHPVSSWPHPSISDDEILQKFEFHFILFSA
jgi:hypothetical protein